MIKYNKYMNNIIYSKEQIIIIQNSQLTELVNLILHNFYNLIIEITSKIILYKVRLTSY
jgi:hypothetical protein